MVRLPVNCLTSLQCFMEICKTSKWNGSTDGKDNGKAYPMQSTAHCFTFIQYLKESCYKVNGKT